MGKIRQFFFIVRQLRGQSLILGQSQLGFCYSSNLSVVVSSFTDLLAALLNDSGGAAGGNPDDARSAGNDGSASGAGAATTDKEFLRHRSTQGSTESNYTPEQLSSVKRLVVCLTLGYG